MTKTIFISATGTNVGKTYTTLKIMELFCANGVKAVPFKPIETGVDGLPLDASALLDKYHSLYSDNTLCLDDICPYRFAPAAAPYIAKNAQSISIETIKSSLQKLKSRSDVVLIEGAGGLMTPIEKEFFMIDLAKELAEFTLLVSHTGLGCINDALLSKKALEDKKMPHAIVFNRREKDDFDVVSKSFLAEYLGVVYEIKDLKSVISF
jgi:dethiobiotin synthetase